MNKNAVRMVSRDGLAELLNDPLRRGVCSHINMEQLSVGMFDHYKNIEHAKGRSNGYAKVTCDDVFGMIADKGGLALRWTAFARPFDAVIGHVFTHGSWRDLQTEFEQQLVGDAFLAPRWIVHGHAVNEGL